MSVFQTNCVACNSKLRTAILSNVGVLCSTCKNQGLFRKKIIITGITRMNQGNVCVSGIDPETWRFIRPVFPTGLDRDFVMEGRTQVVRHFNLVEMEFKEYIPNNIFHTEDWLINERFAPKYVRHLSEKEIINVISKMSITNLNAAIDKKDKSLFIVKAKSIDDIYDEISYGKFKVRISFTDASNNNYTRIPVTDLLVLAKVRWMIANNQTDYGEKMMKTFNNSSNRYIRIGLTREFQGQHWKQVTALITIPDMFNGESFAYYEKKLGGQA